MEYPALRVDRWDQQAPELRAAFQELMYGWLPEAEALDLDGVEPLAEDDALTMVLRRLRSKTGRRIDALHAEPRGGARATFVGVNFHGNHTATDVAGVPPPQGWTYPNGPAVCGSEPERWSIPAVVRAGFGLVTFCHSDVVPDNAELAAPVLGQLSDRPLGAVGAWAWGMASVAKCVDGPAVFVGHSRMGKAALLAGAIYGGAAVSIQSGCGGAAPSRTRVGETVGQITQAFPHWFVPAFAKFAGREEALPFDQHQLMALCAPHPLLLLNADDDLWANPAGQEAMAELARPVYESFGAGDALQYRRRPGGHSVITEDWAMILRFAETLSL